MNERQVQQEILGAIKRCADSGADPRHVVRHLLACAAGASVGARIDSGEVIRDLQRALDVGHGADAAEERAARG